MSSSLPISGTATDTPAGVSGMIVVDQFPTVTAGNWSTTLTIFFPGLNSISIRAGDNATPPNATTITRSVTYVPQPTRTTGAATLVAASSATLNAAINPNGQACSALFQYGLTTSYGSTAAITLSPNNGLTAQNISTAISGLAPGSTYHFRVCVTNSFSTYYGSDLTFTTAASTDANLSNLVLSAGTLAPAFSTALTSYSATVGNSVSVIVATPATSNSNAITQVRVNGGSYVAATTSLGLNVGSNTVDVRVTAQDGSTTRTYTVTVTRNSALQDWQQSNGISNLTGDSDGDGIPNLAEFAFNTPPGVSNPSPCGCGTASNPGDGLNYFVFSYPRRIVPAGVVYTVQLSSNLSGGSWLSPSGDITETGAVPTGDGVTETVTVRIGPL